ncbi:MAG: sulfurtransferase TusA family protein [Promethearchaeati archaeon SRVP18_Atabeyarchaeia-1]
MKRETLDVRGKICPIPLLLTKRKLESMSEGEVLEVLSDFPQSKDNIRQLAERTGNETLKVEEEKGTYRIVIRRKSGQGIRSADEADLPC